MSLDDSSDEGSTDLKHLRLENLLVSGSMNGVEMGQQIPL
jgi:hypothetical protein